MQGRRVLSFSATKKDPTPTEEEDGQMIPAASDSLMPCSLWPLFQGERDYTGNSKVEENQEEDQ